MAFLKLNGLLFAALFGVASVSAQEQTDSVSRHLPEVVVSGLNKELSRRDPLNIAQLSASKLAATQAPTLAGALTAIPGVERLGTGQGIGKPVVRGLYGNRILVLLDGLKFDNQQWQDEHGLGLSTAGVGRVEVVLGPAAVLYGSEAVGGVVHVIGEQPDADKTTRQTDANLRYFSNTAGWYADIGTGKNTSKGWYQLRGSAENHTDYSDGNSDRVLNSRFAAYTLRGSLARRHQHGQTTLHATTSVSQYGFVLEDLDDFFDADARRSRQFAGPHHNVFLQIVSAENTCVRGAYFMKMNVGVQSNLRQEDEGGGQISLNMHLVSMPWAFRLTRDLGRGRELTLAAIGALENNTNYGARIIVPDANMSEQGLSVFFRKKQKTLTLELGAGAGDKFIQTFETRGLNTPDKNLEPFRRNKLSATGLAGVAWNPSGRWTLKYCAASGFRAPNLAELSSNGLHEGIFRYEIGNPGLRNEQNVNMDLSVQRHGALLATGFSCFLNRFRDYIYLAPTAETFFGFPVFRFQQRHATLGGGEAFVRFFMKYKWQFTNTFSVVRGLREDGQNLPFIPAPKWVSRLERSGFLSKKLPKTNVFIETVRVFQQKRPARYETETAAYWLLNAGFGATFSGKHPMSLRLAARNLLDCTYFDHLSRYKHLGIYEPGRELVLSFKIQLF